MPEQGERRIINLSTDALFVTTCRDITCSQCKAEIKKGSGVWIVLTHTDEHCRAFKEEVCDSCIESYRGSS